MSSLNTQHPAVSAPANVHVSTSCALVDLTVVPRVGFRGAHAATYLNARGFDLPERPNTAVSQSDGSMVARLSHTEYLILGSFQDHGERVADEEARWELDHTANYMLPRQDSHAWMQLSGPSISQVMAKLCGVDLSCAAFPPGAVAQTSAARINVILINGSDDAHSKYHILVDRASLDYFKGAVHDAMDEFREVAPD